MPRFFFHVNGETDAAGFNMSGLAAARRHAHALEESRQAQASQWTLTVTDEGAATVLELPSLAGGAAE